MRHSLSRKKMNYVFFYGKIKKKIFENGEVMKLSIIVINYKTFELTKNTLLSIFRQIHTWDYEVILVDNASNDGSIESLREFFSEEIGKKRLLIIENNDNLGFSRANNIGVNVSRGEYLLFLNSDTEVMAGCLESCLQKMEGDLSIGALGCKVILESGKLDHACKRGFPTPEASLYYFLGWDKKDPKKYGQYNALYLSEDEEGEVDALTGAFMMMRRSVFEQVGRFDEDYFMYAEDIDLCYRIKQNGYKIVYYPTACIVHYKGGSGKKRKKGVIYDFHYTMWIFYKKHYKKNYPTYVSFAVYVGIWFKYFISLLKNALKE